MCRQHQPRIIPDLISGVYDYFVGRYLYASLLWPTSFEELFWAFGTSIGDYTYAVRRRHQTRDPVNWLDVAVAETLWKTLYTSTTMFHLNHNWDFRHTCEMALSIQKRFNGKFHSTPFSRMQRHHNEDTQRNKFNFIVADPFHSSVLLRHSTRGVI